MYDRVLLLFVLCYFINILFPHVSHEKSLVQFNCQFLIDLLILISCLFLAFSLNTMVTISTRLHDREYHGNKLSEETIHRARGGSCFIQLPLYTGGREGLEAAKGVSLPKICSPPLWWLIKVAVYGVQSIFQWRCTVYSVFLAYFVHLLSQKKEKKNTQNNNNPSPSDSTQEGSEKQWRCTVFVFFIVAVYGGRWWTHCGEWPPWEAERTRSKRAWGGRWTIRGVCRGCVCGGWWGGGVEEELKEIEYTRIFQRQI